MYEDIISQVRTKEDQTKLIEELELLLKGLYEERGLAFEGILKNRVRGWVSSKIKDQTSNPEISKERFLRDLLARISQLKTIHLTLAFEPSQDALERFSGFIEHAVGEHVILTISYDPNVIGGVEIIYKGHFRDFSFKRIFEKEFEKSRGEFLSILEKEK